MPRAQYDALSHAWVPSRSRRAGSVLIVNPSRCHSRCTALPDLLGQRDPELVVHQRLDRLDETHRVRELRVLLERGQVAPARVDVELVRIAYGLERAVAEAVGL